MRADLRFLLQTGEFWANIRTISQEVGYTERDKKSIKIPTIDAIKASFKKLGLNTGHIIHEEGELTALGHQLIAYFDYRANILNNTVQYNLMTKTEAEKEFSRLRALLNPKCPLPMNKQKTKSNRMHFYRDGQHAG